MTQPMSTNDDFDGLSTDAVNGFRKAQNASIVVNSGDQQSALMSQFLNAASQNNTHNSEDQGIQHVNLTGDSKNVVIVMQQALAQSQEQTQPVLQDLSSITTNNDIMVSSPLTWAKSEILTPEESVSFVTPRQPANRKNVTMVPQQYDNENSEDPMIPNPCLVCGDRASGFHYSVYSCEGCKGFFKRSVQKALNYTCKESASCLINKYSRNSCQYCRFQKCLQIGMKREAVREDRSPGGKHRHKRQCTDDVGGGGILAQAFDSDDPFRETPHQQQQTTPSYTPTHQHAIKLQRLSASSSPTGGSRSPAEHPLLESLLSAKPHLYPKGGTEKTEGLSVNELMQYGYLELRFIIEWAKKVPGFSDLCLADQMSLLKSSFMELNVLRLAYRSMHLDNKIKFAEDVILPLDYCESIGWGRELVDGIIDFAHKLKEISLDLPEFCILNAIILMYPDAQCLEDKMTIANNQSQILDSLRHLLLKRHPCDDKRLGKILLRLPALRTVSAKAAERFLSLTFDGSVELNDLVLEMMN